MIINGTTYKDGTPKLVAHLLETYRSYRTVNNRTAAHRLTLYYGKDGKLWGDDPVFNSGYIGHSTGQSKIPLLIHNARSRGGGAILDDCIVGIRHARKTRSGGVHWVYQHPDYKHLLNDLNTLHVRGVKEDHDEEAITCP